MKYFLALTALAGLASAHSLVSHFHVNGNADSSCVRVAYNTDPITDLSSEAMACNVGPGPAKSKCVVQAGDSVAFEWRVDPRVAAKDYPRNSEGEKVGVTDTSHLGPCAVYMKKVDDSLSASGAGSGWFKIYQDGVDSSNTFCTTRLRESDAPLPAVIPSTIASGDYLLRAEMLTLNDAGARSIGGQEIPQFYPGCVQVTVENGAGTATPETVSIPGYVGLQSPGLIYDIWTNTDFTDYQIPGPKLFVDGASGGGGAVVPSKSDGAATKTSAAAVKTSTTATAAKPTTTLATSTKAAGGGGVGTVTRTRTMTMTTTSTSAVEPSPTHCGRRCRYMKKHREGAFRRRHE